MVKRCQRIESQIGRSQSTECLKTNNKHKTLINIGRLEKHCRTLLTESRLEFIRVKESIEDKDELLETDI